MIKTAKEECTYLIVIREKIIHILYSCTSSTVLLRDFIYLFFSKKKRIGRNTPTVLHYKKIPRIGSDEATLTVTMCFTLVDRRSTDVYSFMIQQMILCPIQ
jgi:hypothetical protein